MRTCCTGLQIIAILSLFVPLAWGQLCAEDLYGHRASLSQLPPASSEDSYLLSAVGLGPSSATSVAPKLEAALRAAPDSTVTVWVFFADKGTVEEIAGAVAELERRFSPRALVRRAKTGKDPLIDWRDLPVLHEYVESLRSLGLRVRATSKWLNAVSVRCRAQDAAHLSQLPFVTKVEPVASFPKRDISFEEIRPATDASLMSPGPATVPRESQSSTAPGDTSFYGATWRQLDMLQVPALHTENVTGNGVFIGVLDTGFNLNHEALQDVQVSAQWDFINWDSVTANEPDQDPTNQHNHGTMILGIVGGHKPGVYSGVAFDAEFALAKTEDVSSETPVEEDYWVMGVEWLDSLGVDLVTSSLGYIDWYTYEHMDGNTAVTTIAADIAVANGVSVFTAMGNGGTSAYPYAIAPADGDSVMSIGGVDSLGVYWPASSRGPTYDGRTKPEIVTQGSAVYCIHPNDSTSYGRASGTSCATPLAAGCGALILQKNLNWNPIMLREAIRSTGTNSASPDTIIGWGILQAEDASDWLIVAVLDEPVTRGQSGSAVIDIRSIPNPFNPCTAIHVQLLSAGESDATSAGVFDIAGRCVRDFGVLDIQAGSAIILWDGKDGSGKMVSSGAYFFTVRTGDTSETRKLLLLK